MRAILCGVTAALILLSVGYGCSRMRKSESAFKRVPEAKMDEPQLEQMRRAIAARDAMASQLLAELTKTLNEHGPAGSIHVCRDIAPALAAHTSKKYDVAIGRTSFCLRNPFNTPPDWAQPYVLERRADPVFLTNADGEMAALLPIVTKPMCVACHGPKDQIAEPVLAALKEEYPADEATGFEPGDLRGWFWVEVPPVDEP